jgi:hypothetical protein
MVSNEKHAREALEKLFARPFSDYQWSLISAQGYEDAIVSGARNVQEVAQELKDLMEAAGKGSPTAGPDAAGTAEEVSLTWDQMEKLVLGRILTTGETSGPRATPGSPNSGARVHRLTADRQRSRKRLWTILSLCLLALLVAAAAVLVFFGPVWGLWGTSPLATTTTGPSTIAGSDPPGVSSTTISTLTPPATIPALEMPDYVAHLTGADVVPSVYTAATGILELTLSDDGQSIRYVLTVQSFTGLTVARLRLGLPGSVGEEIVSLYPGPTKKGLFSGKVAEWAFDADAFVGSLKGKTMADFIALVESGSVYVNVGSIGNRDGEIRGQLE